MKRLVVDDDPDLLALVAFAPDEDTVTPSSRRPTHRALRVFDVETAESREFLDINCPRAADSTSAEHRGAPGSADHDADRARRGRRSRRALELGADDYLTKRSARALCSRAFKALLRRAGIRPGTTWKRAGFHSISSRMRSRLRAGRAPLNGSDATTADLVAQAGHVVSAERCSSVWGHRGSGDRQLLKQLVHRLRQKLERDPAEPICCIPIGRRLSLKA